MKEHNDGERGHLFGEVHIFEIKCQNLGSLCTTAKQKYRNRIMEKERVASFLCQAKGEHSRLVASRNVPPSLVSREKLYSQAGVCDRDQGNNSLVFFLLQSSKWCGS